MQLRHLATLVFDCDGVVLDSNKVKSKAFFNAALPFGEGAAAQLAEYHVQNGGISRYRKFDYFLSHIVGGTVEPGTLNSLLERYASEVRAGLSSCEIAPGLDELRASTPRTRWLVVSGSDQDELRSVFNARGLTRLFDGGIFGSPAAKGEILAREITCGNIIKPAVFLGDSKYDFEVATSHGLGFIFVSGWSEFGGWRQLQASEGFPHVESLWSLIDA